MVAVTNKALACAHSQAHKIELFHQEGFEYKLCIPQGWTFWPSSAIASEVCNPSSSSKKSRCSTAFICQPITRPDHSLECASKPLLVHRNT